MENFKAFVKGIESVEELRNIRKFYLRRFADAVDGSDEEDYFCKRLSILNVEISSRR